jgi:predicted RNA binding protein YcfA (HicA-like mRNA interferase family)
MKLPRVTGEKVLKALQRAGFSLVHIRGSHHFLYHQEKDCLVTVPVHTGIIIAPKTLKSILSQAELNSEEFAALL